MNAPTGPRAQDGSTIIELIVVIFFLMALFVNVLYAVEGALMSTSVIAQANHDAARFLSALPVTQRNQNAGSNAGAVDPVAIGTARAIVREEVVMSRIVTHGNREFDCYPCSWATPHVQRIIHTRGSGAAYSAETIITKIQPEISARYAFDKVKDGGGLDNFFWTAGYGTRYQINGLSYVEYPYIYNSPW
jgi:hypothetical protein